MKEPLLKKTVRLPADIWDVILELSEDHNTTPSTIIRILLRNQITEIKEKQYEGK